MSRSLVIGLDFDNTIVSYDALFYRVAREMDVVPESTPQTKNAVRNHLREVGREPVWTEMQGTVYGARMDEAIAFPGALASIKALRADGHQVRVISHKTRYPFLGEQHDLHSAARHWLEINGFFDPNLIGMKPEEAFFEETKEAKLGRAEAEGCTHFVDDLPEILAHQGFPHSVHRILFDPNNEHLDTTWSRLSSWPQITTWFKNEAVE